MLVESETLLRRLLDQAYLFDDPSAYEAGVRDAIEAFTIERETPGENPQETTGHRAA